MSGIYSPHSYTYLEGPRASSQIYTLKGFDMLESIVSDIVNIQLQFTENDPAWTLAFLPVNWSLVV